jgi:hypothetical protein
VTTETEMDGHRTLAFRLRAHEVCRLQQSNTCVMDERPYRGHCTFDNCEVMRSLRELINKLDAT